MSTLTKADIAEYLHRKLGFTRQRACIVVDIFFTELKQVLTSEQSVKLSGFGNFELRDKGARPGRNPRTGKTATISPRRVVTFKASRKLRAKIESTG